MKRYNMKPAVACPPLSEGLGKPTVPEVLPIMRRYLDTEGNSAGGSLHIVLDDGNVSDGDVLFCIEYAKERCDKAGVELAEILLRMSKTQRKKLSGMAGARQRDPLE